MTLKLAALDETAAVARLHGFIELSTTQRSAAVTVAAALVAGARARADERPYLDAFLQEFGLTNPEGIALMCLAEALLRVPDEATADRLIAEKLSAGDWASHSGRSDSVFVNASTWALMLTGQLVDLPEDMRRDAGGWFRNLSRRAGEPLVRSALRRAMKIIGSEFVVGRTIDEALDRSEREDDLRLCSYDMLGEGARTDADALRYLASYENAIRAVGERGSRLKQPGQNRHAAVHTHSAISIKLSALDPRYCESQRDSVMRRLVPRVRDLVRLGAQLGIGVTIDAEEADRLELSLEVISALAHDAATRDWPGLGLALQAYGKRAPEVIDHIVQLARDSGRRMAVRLVKGAYWDSEVKRAQERGLDGYPVYTRKVNTDVSYLACAGRLLRTGDVIYPQFATHNAHTIAAVLQMRPLGAAMEFQRLHGMGRLLYAEAQQQLPDFPPVRVYAPVGAHADLLAYLVRRLLENGANTSFVNRFMDELVPIADIVKDPIIESAALESAMHPKIPLPANLFGVGRRNSSGVDFGDPAAVQQLLDQIGAFAAKSWTAAPIVSGGQMPGATTEVRSPTDRRVVVGISSDATPAHINAAFAQAAAAQPAWNRRGGAARADCLERAADLLEAQHVELLALLIREAGKTLPDAVAEVREAVDFCRYYAAQARTDFAAPKVLPGPTGERNELSLHGRGVFVCISPWNFPLAIFVGQISAALAAGNAVLAKPAEPTTLIGAAAVRLLHKAGVPVDVLHCLPCAGAAFGETALHNAALAGVAFTGSTATALNINRALAARDGAILPLIAETGGINAMIVDSTSLPEQVVDDVVSSAFISAGQRCSALRLLFVQRDVADRVIEMLVGAMDELVIGDPAHITTDIGPVITGAAAAKLEQHIARMQGEAKLLKRCRLSEACAAGSFVAPTLIELNSAQQLQREEFGPVLHVVRYAASELPAVLEAIRASGYGLTLGMHTRIDSAWHEVFDATAVGNTYINRNIIGAVVGVQPFGGQGLSGTGPKAGGPHYLHRFAVERTLTVNTVATGGNASLLALD